VDIQIIQKNYYTYSAAALGANIIEKHFTLDKTWRRTYHKALYEPEELKKMIQGIRNVEIFLGSGIKMFTEMKLIQCSCT
jgi:N,N'-diacetyllegionaminate synthase